MLSKSSFTPSEHGYHFANGTFHFTVLGFDCSVLCGGMSYSALDYYLMDMDIPTSTFRPFEGSRLFMYLYNRQRDAHMNTIPSFISAWGSGPSKNGGVETDPVNSLSRGDRFNKIVEQLATDVPVVLCLIGTKFAKGHHVLAVAAFDTSPQQIQLYDSNYPDRDDIFLTAMSNKPLWRHTDGSLWRGFFIDDGYRATYPPINTGEGSWKLCAKCSSLYHSASGPGPCAAGGVHATFTKMEYSLPTHGSRGESGWSHCSKCKELVWIGDGRRGVCPQGGNHEVDVMKNYVLPMNGGKGEPYWFWCSFCSSLYYQKPNTNAGCCPTGGGHMTTSKAFYCIPGEIKGLVG